MKNNHFTKLMYIALATTVAITPAVYATSTNYGYVSTAAATSSVTITNTYGDLETASITWNPVKNATGYNVYYKSASAPNSAYTQLDTELIRQYASYMRADVLGLEEGNYIFRVVPIIDGVEAISKQAITSTIKVSEHTREGFAFSPLSPMGTGSGGYNDDGTVAENAQIIYVSADTVNTIKLDIITNSKGSTTTCTGLVDILTKRQKAYDKRPLIIRMIGTIDGSDIKGLNSNGYLQMKGIYNTTLEGVGEDATVRGWGLLVRDAHNVEIRNLGFMLFPDDAISLDTDNENIWVHNNDIFYGTAGSDSDQAKGDGSADVKGLSNYVTVSYNHFFDSGKSSLCGMNDTDEFFVTYHHNWFDHSDSRHPRIRVGTVHIYNNYFDGNAKYGVGVTKGSSAFVEANYFRNCKNPMLTSLQGSDIASGSKGNFSLEPGGMIKAYNNTIEGAKPVFHTAHATQFDAYLASSRNEVVSSAYKSVSGGNTYNNFDTSSDMYRYTPDAPQDVEAIVTAYAGRMNGGDFSWAFTTADDKSYSVNVGLMAALKSYSSDLVAIGGNSIPGIIDPSDSEISGDNNNSDNDNTTDDSNNSDNDNTTDDSNNSDNDNTTDDSNSDDDNTTDDSNSDDDNTTDDSDNTTDNDNNVDEIVPMTYAHNFTTHGNENDFFTIKGNLSSSKGTVKYDGLTLTTCLKVESSTSIKFKSEEKSTLTLVFNPNFNKEITIDGTDYKVTNGILNVELKPGTHTITKADTANLFYISLN